MKGFEGAAVDDILGERAASLPVSMLKSLVVNDSGAASQASSRALLSGCTDWHILIPTAIGSVGSAMFFDLGALPASRSDPYGVTETDRTVVGQRIRTAGLVALGAIVVSLVDGWSDVRRHTGTVAPCSPASRRVAALRPAAAGRLRR